MVKFNVGDNVKITTKLSGEYTRHFNKVVTILKQCVDKNEQPINFYYVKENNCPWHETELTPYDGVSTGKDKVTITAVDNN